MDILSPFIGAPRRILIMQRFGTGEFSAKQIAEKCLFVKQRMQERRAVSATPFFTVVVPAHKEGSYLLATLRSLAKQRFQDVEFLIVVNGEPRGSLTERIARDCGFCVIHQRRGGVARARDKGLRAAKGKIIVTTDADTLQDHAWLQGIEQEWAYHPKMVCGYGWLRALSTSFWYQLCMQAVNLWRSVQGRSMFFTASEANSWYVRTVALRAGGYRMNCDYAEGTMLFRKMIAYGEMHCGQTVSTSVYTSDRRTIADKCKAVAQYFYTIKPQSIRYTVVR